MMKRVMIAILVLMGLLGCARKANLSPAERFLKPDSAEYLTNEGIMALNSKQFDIAEQKLQAALKKNPQIIAAWNTLGLTYTYKRDFPKAIAAFEKLLKIDPNFYDANNNLGMIYSEMGDYDKAKENFLIAANAPEYQTPENAFANLAALEINAGKFESAMRYTDKGMLFNKKFPHLYSLKGIALEKLERISEALTCYEKAIALQKDPEPMILFYMGRDYYRLGDKEKALNMLELALPRARDPEFKQQILDFIKMMENTK